MALIAQLHTNGDGVEGKTPLGKLSHDVDTRRYMRP